MEKRKRKGPLVDEIAAIKTGIDELKREAADVAGWLNNKVVALEEIEEVLKTRPSGPISRFLWRMGL